MGGNCTRHEQREFTCSAVQYDILRTGHFRSQAQLAIVSKEPILCSVNVDISVICQAVQVCRVLLHCLGSFILHDICFRGAKCGKEGFFREMLLTCI